MSKLIFLLTTSLALLLLMFSPKGPFKTNSDDLAQIKGLSGQTDIREPVAPVTKPERRN